jgi:hypothetical protein
LQRLSFNSEEQLGQKLEEFAAFGSIGASSFFSAEFLG